MEAWLGLVGCAALAAAVVVALLVAPAAVGESVAQRILYLHAPSAFAAYGCIAVVAIASAVYLWKRSAAADRLAVAAAEVGVLMCTLVLVTGSIWGRARWGAWWTPDPRLTLTLILWAIYLSYVLLRAFGGDDEEIAPYAAVLGIVGVLAIPAIRVSARLMKGMHPSVLAPREGGSGLTDPSMRLAFWGGTVALLLVAACLVLLRARLERIERQASALRRLADAAEGA
ncbi:MAG TPA: cytochrome c biogenesis protein CcsA [Candidatus Limnocylindria bacterium]|nr:cytochrome c biogenesis protein CcsA [Candidatus Limnocylindria bacterium]